MFIDCLHLACVCKIMLKCLVVNYLWTNKYLYFYMYISVYLQIYIYILCLLSKYKNVFIYVFMSMPTNGCIHIFPHICICMCLPLYIYTYMCMWHYVCLHIHIHPYVYIYIFIYLFISGTQHALLKVHGAATIIADNLPMIHPKHCSGRKTSKIWV